MFNWLKSFYLWFILVFVFSIKKNPDKFYEIISSLNEIQNNQIEKIGRFASGVRDGLVNSNTMTTTGYGDDNGTTKRTD